MNNNNEVNEIIKILENIPDCITTFRAISLIKRQAKEVSQVGDQLKRCQDIITYRNKTITRLERTLAGRYK